MRRSKPTRSDRRLERLETAARLAGLELTHRRLETFRELAGTEEHPGAQTDFRAVRQRVPTVSLDSVHGTLWALHDLALVRRSVRGATEGRRTDDEGE